MRYAYASFRQNLCYIYTAYFDICTSLFYQFLVAFNTKYFKQICQVYLLTPLKKCRYISGIWLAVNETRMSIKEKEADVNEMEVQNNDLSIRINMENLCLREDFLRGDHVSRHDPNAI